MRQVRSDSATQRRLRGLAYLDELKSRLLDVLLEHLHLLLHVGIASVELLLEFGTQASLNAAQGPSQLRRACPGKRIKQQKL